MTEQAEKTGFQLIDIDRFRIKSKEYIYAIEAN